MNGQTTFLPVGCLRRFLNLAGAVLMSCLLMGCSLDPFGTKKEVQAVRTSTSEDVRILSGDVRRLQDELNNLLVRFDGFSSAQEREIAALKAAVKGLEQQVGQAAVSTLSEVDRKIAELDAKRIADKNELVAKINTVVDRINVLSKRLQTASPARPGTTETISQKGFYYTVEEGDTLWGIANKFRSEYGVTVDAIRQANNMTASDSRIVSGQKLFIPVKE